MAGTMNQTQLKSKKSLWGKTVAAVVVGVFLLSACISGTSINTSWKQCTNASTGQFTYYHTIKATSDYGWKINYGTGAFGATSSSAYTPSGTQSLNRGIVMYGHNNVGSIIIQEKTTGQTATISKSNIDAPPGCGPVV